MPAALERLDPASATVLFGAGVSRDAGAPTAGELVAAVAEALVAEPRWQRWVVEHAQPDGELRFETLMDALTSVADPDLSLLAFLDGLGPGRLHSALARAAALGARLVTVNFDDLAEQAIARAARAWTVDLQQRRGEDRLLARGAVAKLHGTRLLHTGGGDPDRPGTPLHATIAAIVAAGGGAGLPPPVEQRLRELVDGRALVVLGYSGSDDLDVMPSLAQCRPRRVVWVRHATGPVERVPPSEAGHGAVEQLLATWEGAGATLAAARGETGAALAQLGWEVGAPDRAGAADAERRWRDHVARWGEEARSHDPTGRGWVAQLAGSLGLFHVVEEALAGARAAERADGLWTEPRRLFELAENAYMRSGDRAEVRRRAEVARAAAEACGDVALAASCRVLAARTFLDAAQPDSEAAARELRAAREALRGTSAPGVEADVDNWTARVAVERGDYEAAARLALAAAERYRSIGDLELHCEALQVAGKASSLDGAHDRAIELLREAARIAATGPYPEREIAVRAALASRADAVGDVEEASEQARAMIAIALRIEHLAEVSQGYAMLGLALSELGDHPGAAGAFRRGLDALVPEGESFRDLLACGLAESLLHAGEPGEALRVLDANAAALAGRPSRRLHAAAIRWRAGAASEREVLAAAEALAASDPEPEGQTTFALVRLGVPGPDAAAYVAEARELIEEAGQLARLARLDAAAEQPPAPPST